MNRLKKAVTLAVLLVATAGFTFTPTDAEARRGFRYRAFNGPSAARYYAPPRANRYYGSHYYSPRSYRTGYRGYNPYFGYSRGVYAPGVGISIGF